MIHGVRLFAAEVANNTDAFRLRRSIMRAKGADETRLCRHFLADLGIKHAFVFLALASTSYTVEYQGIEPICPH